MCLACNPLCGGCKPPRMTTVLCLRCKTYGIFDIEISENPTRKSCRTCGFDVTELAVPPIVHCESSGMLCANPCGFRSKAPEDGVPVECKNITHPLADRPSTPR